jgi:hypothetical protein
LVGGGDGRVLRHEVVDRHEDIVNSDHVTELRQGSPSRTTIVSTTPS